MGQEQEERLERLRLDKEREEKEQKEKEEKERQAEILKRKEEEDKKIARMKKEQSFYLLLLFFLGSLLVSLSPLSLFALFPLALCLVLNARDVLLVLALVFEFASLPLAGPQVILASVYLPPIVLLQPFLWRYVLFLFVQPVLSFPFLISLLQFFSVPRLFVVSWLLLLPLVFPRFPLQFFLFLIVPLPASFVQTFVVLLPVSFVLQPLFVFLILLLDDVCLPSPWRCVLFQLAPP